MKSRKLRNGFTLLEVILVLIIIGVLASLAVPRLLRMVEFSYATEALRTTGDIKRALNNCAVNSDSMDYAPCCFFSRMNIDDPGLAPGSHFNYTTTCAGFPSITIFQVLATRKTDLSSSISTTFFLTTGTKSVVGTGTFSQIK